MENKRQKSKQRLAEIELEVFKNKHSPSEGQLALHALMLHNGLGLRPPQWAIEKIINCYRLYQFGIECDFNDEKISYTDTERRLHLTLDEAFGAKKRISRQVNARWKETDLRTKVYDQLQKRYNAGETIDEGIFERIGKDLGISGGVANKYYRNLLDQGRPSISGKSRKQREPDELKAEVNQLIKNWEKLQFP